MRLKDLDEEIKALEKSIKDLKTKLKEIRKERIDFIIKNNLYETDLSKYNNKRLLSICMICSDGEAISRYGDGLSVFDNKVSYSSMYYGFIRWNSLFEAYDIINQGQARSVKVIGYFDIITEDSL